MNAAGSRLPGSQDQRVAAAVREGDIPKILSLISPGNAQCKEDECATIRSYRDSQQRSLAHIAILVDNLHVLECVLASGLDPDAACEDDEGTTPMAQAILSQNLSALRILLSHGSSANQLDSDHHTLLHLLAIHSSGDKDADRDNGTGMVNQLLLRGDINIDARDRCGNTPLHLSAVYESASVALELICGGADVNAANGFGSTPLHFASATGDAVIVSLLLDAGADVNIADSTGNTPLIDAAFVSQHSSPHFAFGDERTQSEVVRLLLRSGADASAVNAEGNNALFGAVRNGFADVVEQLSRMQPACFQRRNNYQETLFHVAARAQVTSLSIWETLLQCCGIESVASVDRFERTCVSIWMSWPQSDADGEIAEASQSSARAVVARIRTVSRLLQSIK